MKEDNNFADVTLACEDGQQVEAHKVIFGEAKELKLKGLSGQNSEDLAKLHSPLKSKQNPSEKAKDSVPLVKEIQSVHIGDVNQEVSLAGG